MTNPNPLAEEDLSLLARRTEKLRSELRNADPVKLAERTGSEYVASDGRSNEFHILFWGDAVSISFPDFIAVDQKTGQVLPIALQALILYYFYTADETLPSGIWISFSELPDGRFYTHAFQSYTGSKLAQSFGGDLAAFQLTASRCNSLKKFPDSRFPGDAAFAFQVLPKVSLLVVFWQGDEDFPSSFQILFDASISHFLPSDVCAIMGSMLTQRLIRNKKAST